MIVTLTPNPSVDRAYDLVTLAVGEVNRAHAVHVDAGGKGINVSRALAANGVDTVAVLPVGGADGALLVSLLGPAGVAARPVDVPGDTRSNITVQAGVTTKINAPGPRLDDAARDALLAATTQTLAPGDVVMAAGSLPLGCSDDFYVTLGEAVRAKGAHLVLDTSGPAFAAAVQAGGLALVKPNDEELAELAGRDLPTVGDVVAVAREIIAAGTRLALVSLGAHGALLVTAEHTWWAGGTALRPASTVGAGDTTLAGFLASAGHDLLGADLASALVTAVAWGRAAVMLPGTAVPTPDLVHPQDVTLVVEPDPALEVALLTARLVPSG